MRKMPATYLACLTLVGALLAAGCGGDGDDPKPASDGSLTVYSSLPRQGIAAPEAAAVAAGQRLALADARSRAGGRRVRLVELDSGGDEDEVWDPGDVEANAKRAADDDSAVAYLGELDLGGTAVSLPVTSRADLLQVTPGDPLPSLTQPDPGGGGEGPARYHPDGTRTFVRLVPHGGLEARELVEWARERDARSLAIVRDDGVLSREQAAWALGAANRERIPTEVERARGGQDDYEDLAGDVAERRPGAVLLTVTAGPGADRLVADLRAALPGVPLLAAGGVAADPPDGVDFLDSFLPPAEYGSSGRALLRRIARRAGGAAGPAALYGYEAMRLVLAAIDRAQASDAERRAAVARAATGARRVERSALGPYSLTADGDVTTSVLGAYRSAGGRVRPLGVRRLP